MFPPLQTFVIENTVSKHNHQKSVAIYAEAADDKFGGECKDLTAAGTQSKWEM